MTDTVHPALRLPIRLFTPHPSRPQSRVAAVLHRERTGAPLPVRRPVPDRWAVRGTVARLHSRRISAVAWMPQRNNLLVTGDKVGSLYVHVRLQA